MELSRKMTPAHVLELEKLIYEQSSAKSTVEFLVSVGATKAVIDGWVQTLHSTQIKLEATKDALQLEYTPEEIISKKYSWRYDFRTNSIIYTPEKV